MKKAVISLLSLISIVSWSTSLLVTTDVNLKLTEGDDTAKVNIFATDVNEQDELARTWSKRIASQDTLPITRGVAVSLNRFPSTVLGASTPDFSQIQKDQAIQLVRPGVVSIINKLEGEYAISDFDINMETFDLTPRSDLPIHKTLIKDRIGYGSGFVVNTDGYIATNAHVVAKTAAYDVLLTEIMNQFLYVINLQEQSLTIAEAQSYLRMLDQKFGTDPEERNVKMLKMIQEKIKDYAKKQAKESLKQTLVVIDKNLKNEKFTEGKEIKEIISKSIPAQLVTLDPNYIDTGKDVAIIKISNPKLPTLSLAKSDGLSTGDNVLVFGFPANAKVDMGDWFEMTISQGSINSIKEITKQKVFQLDNKISQGSSGGPITNIHGQAVGIITYVTSDSAAVGDSYGYALPIELVKEAMESEKIANDLGNYAPNFLLGLDYKNQLKCKKSIAAFDVAIQTNSQFNVDSEVASFKEACGVLMASNATKDNWSGALKLFFRDHKANAYTAVAILLAMLIFAVLLGIKLFKHFRHRASPVAPMTT